MFLWALDLEVMMKSSSGRVGVSSGSWLADLVFFLALVLVFLGLLVVVVGKGSGVESRACWEAHVQWSVGYVDTNNYPQEFKYRYDFQRKL